MGPTLSLLLVFRTNSSYERFLEARKAQSSMLQACRNIASHASVHVPAEDWPELARLLVGYAILQKQHLQGRVDSSELAAVFSQELLAEVEARNNRPLCVIQKIERLIHMSLTNKYHQSAAAGDTLAASAPKYIEKHFIECLHALQAQLASCERIVKQPVPLSYSRHLSRFLSFYLLLLPLSLIQPLGLWAVPMTALIAWSLVSILEIGHWIEQPMDPTKQIIQLNSICSVVRNDVSELGGALGGQELDRLEGRWLQETLENSRDEDEVRLGFYRPRGGQSVGAA